LLVYGVETVLPTDLDYGSPKVKGYDENANQRAREDPLDQIDEARDVGDNPKGPLIIGENPLSKR
jgi:hypothetical protein